MGNEKDMSGQAGAKTTPPFIPSKNTKIVVLSLASQGPSVTPAKLFRLHKERIVIGSVISADVRLLGEGIAPIHAVLEVNRAGSQAQGAATIYDLASDTGVFVNGMKIVTESLKAGDEITVGYHTLKFSLEDVNQISTRERIRESEGRKLFLNPQEDFSPLLLEDEREVEEIFDFRPTSKTALQTVMSWNGTILDVEHFVDEKAITVGEARKNHFGIPPFLSEKRFKLVTRQGENFTLNLDSKMSGVIQKKGQLQPVEGLGAREIPLCKEDFAKINIQGIDFYLSFTAAPPRLKWNKLFEKDPFFLKVFGTSLVITAVTVFALLKASVPQNLEAEQVPERIATILYQPEKFVQKTKVEKMREADLEKTLPKTEPKPKVEKKAEPKPKETVKVEIKPKLKTPKPVPKEMNVAKETKPLGTGPKAKAKGAQAQNEAKEGKGARAKGKEGTRGSPKAAPGKEQQNLAKRPSPQGGPGRGSGNSQVPDEGNVDFLKGATSKIQDILGNSAAHLGKGGEKLAGFGGFTTQGNGGLALSGTGKGGGGDAASLGGLADEGRGGGRVGTGRGASGSGNGIVGGKTRVLIRSGGPEEAVVMGAIDADAIEAALLAHRDEFRLCYEREINAENPTLAGRVGTNFVIGSSGRVTEAGVESTTLNNANAERCIVSVIRRIQFPIPRGAGIVQVTYPFKFSPAGR